MINGFDKDQYPVPNSTAKSVGHAKYWFHDMNELIALDNMNQFLPAKEMSYPAKVNSLVRLSWYVGILGGLFTANPLYLYIPVVTMIITYVLYLFRAQELTAEQFDNKTKTAFLKQQMARGLVPAGGLNLADSKGIDPKLISKFTDYLDMSGNSSKPSDENPFMNPLPFDNRTRAPAVPLLSNPVNRADVEVRFDKGNWRDVNDLWDRNNGKRQFFTMPWTTYPNDQGGFVNWLYKTPPTCKEGNGDQCVANYFNDLTRRTPGTSV